jgi:DTW domain-containing protein YfiP
MTKCPRCLFAACLCGELPVIATRTRIVIVRHHLERYRSSNSGRLAHLSLPNSEIIEHGGREGIARVPALDRGWLLFPEGEPISDRPDVGTLVVLDATWSQARRMFRKVDGVRGLPILRLPDAPMPAARLRAAPGPGRVSTLEAIARALRIIEGDSPAAALEAVFSLAVDRAEQSGRRIAARNAPH